MFAARPSLGLTDQKNAARAAITGTGGEGTPSAKSSTGKEREKNGEPLNFDLKSKTSGTWNACIEIGRT